MILKEKVDTFTHAYKVLVCTHTAIFHKTYTTLFSGHTHTHTDTHTHTGWMTGSGSFVHSWCGKVVSSSSDPTYKAGPDSQRGAVTLSAPSGLSLSLPPAVSQSFSCSFSRASLTCTPSPPYLYFSLILSPPRIHTLQFTIYLCMPWGDSICLSGVHIDFAQCLTNASVQNQSSVLDVEGRSPKVEYSAGCRACSF